MCGLIGAVSKNALAVNMNKFLKNALVVDAVRGAHSTGVARFTKVTKNNVEKRFYDIHKAAVCGGEFVESVFDPATENAGTYALLGHNRYATVGGITSSTAHPFHVGTIIGMHNGTLTGDWVKAMNCPARTEVDSHGMMHSLMHRGYKKTFESLSGAVATVWHDTSTCRTFVYRNRERPLHYAKTFTGTVVYASEKLMLEWLIDRNKIYIDGDVEEFKVNTVYEITDGEVKELEEVRGIQPVYPSYNTGYSSSSYSSSYYSSSNHGTLHLPAPKAHEYDDLEDDEDFFSDVVWPIYGGTKTPTVTELIGPVLGDWLPIRLSKRNTTADNLRMGYSNQRGVLYRGNKLTPYEIAAGVVQEVAELESADILDCDYDNQPCPDAYLEAIPFDANVILSPENLNCWREATGDYDTSFRKVLRVNLDPMSLYNIPPVQRKATA